MPTQSPPPAPPPVSPAPQGITNPYAFLFEEKKKNTKRILPQNSSKKQRFIFVLVVLGVLAVIVILIMGLLGSAGKQSVADLQLAAQQQAEIIRVANIGASKAKDTKTNNFALTISLSLASTQSDTLAILKKAGGNTSTKSLNSGKNTTTDTLLTKAEQANNFDEVFTEEITKALKTYQTSLKNAYAGSSSKSTKTTLQKASVQVNTLLNPTN